MIIDLGVNAVVTGLLLGGFYALASLGLTIGFGLLQIPNVAHPAFMVLGAYCAYFGNLHGLDPVIASAIFAPAFYIAGMIFYQAYFVCFERRGRGNTLQGFTFFFGVAIVVEVVLVLAVGVDLRSVDVSYIGKSLTIGIVTIPYRFIIPFLIGSIVGAGVWLFMTRTHMGLAIRAVAHDDNALRIIALNPARIKRHAFGIAMMTAALAGAALIIVNPVDPFSDRGYIGRSFAIVVLAGMGSVPGTFAAAMIIGVLESLVATFIGASWAPGVAFAALLGTLAVRPSGIFGIAR